MNYGQLAFTDTIKKMQEEAESTSAYDRMEKMWVVDGLTENEVNFISIKGKVKRISLVTNQQTLSDNQNKVNSYLVDIDLPSGLKTNYGVELNFYAEAKGTAEIITADRRLIERFFDNLRHSVK